MSRVFEQQKGVVTKYRQLLDPLYDRNGAASDEMKLLQNLLRSVLIPNHTDIPSLDEEKTVSESPLRQAYHALEAIESRQSQIKELHAVAMHTAQKVTQYS